MNTYNCLLCICKHQMYAGQPRHRHTSTLKINTQRQCRFTTQKTREKNKRICMHACKGTSHAAKRSTRWTQTHTTRAYTKQFASSRCIVSLCVCISWNLCVAACGSARCGRLCVNRVRVCVLRSSARNLWLNDPAIRGRKLTPLAPLRSHARTERKSQR